MASSRTKLGKLGMGTADPVSVLMGFMDFDPNVRKEMRVSPATVGTFYVDENRVRESRDTVLPTFTGEPTASELAFWLAWALGPASGTLYVPQVAVEARNIYWKPEIGDQFFLPGVGVDNFTLSATVGEPVTVTAEMVGTTADDTRNDFPSLAPDVTTQPFMLSDLTATGGAFSFGGSTRQPNGFTLRIQNFIDRNRMYDSLTLTRVQKMDQAFNISFDVASGDNPALWKAGLASVAFSATFKNIVTGASLIITAPAVRFPAQSPRHARGGEGMVTIDGVCLRAGGSGHPLTANLALS